MSEETAAGTPVIPGSTCQRAAQLFVASSHVMDVEFYVHAFENKQRCSTAGSLICTRWAKRIWTCSVSI
jgi:hypothetical protein